MSTIHAATASELSAKLRSIDVTVPLRPEGRKSKHIEIWTSCRLLATISCTRLLDYPLAVKHNDRPDLVLSLPSRCIGIEVTEAIFQDQARVEAISDDQGISDFQHIPHYRAGQSLSSRDEFENIARGKAQSFVRSVNSIERDWVEAILVSAERKAQIFKKPGFKHFTINWLLIYDNLATLLIPADECDALAKLSTRLFNSSWNNPFDRVFVQRFENIWELGGCVAPIRHSIPENWRHSSLNP